MKLAAVPGVEVYLRVNGVPLHEYDDEEHEDESHLKAVKYVEAASGSKFSVFFKADKSQLGADKRDVVECAIFLDGMEICAKILDTFRSLSFNIPGRNSIVNGQHMLQEFTFTDLNTSMQRGYLRDLRPISNVRFRRRFCRTF